MAKRTYDELLKEYGLERKETDFERDMKTYGSKIQTGIEASKKRNAELAAENAKRRKNEESGHTKPEKPSPSAPKSTPKKSPIASATTVRQHKGGGATAEVDTERVARQTKADAVKKPPSFASASQEPKKESKPLRTLSSSDSEAQKERAAEGARKTISKLRRGFKHGKARYDENARIMANRTRLFGALRPGNKQSRRKRGLKIGDD